MKQSFATLIFMVVGFGFPVWCLAGQSDALPGMATHGVVRIPHPGMVNQAFGSTRRPNGWLYQKTHQPSSRIDAQSKESPATLDKSQTLKDPLGSRRSKNLSESNISP